jgi:hypothetical protein
MIFTPSKKDVSCFEPFLFFTLFPKLPFSPFLSLFFYPLFPIPNYDDIFRTEFLPCHKIPLWLFFTFMKKVQSLSWSFCYLISSLNPAYILDSTHTEYVHFLDIPVSLTSLSLWTNCYHILLWPLFSAHIQISALEFLCTSMPTSLTLGLG